MIKIVLWDVYGTLLTTPAQDTPLEANRQRDLLPGFKKLEEMGIHIPADQGTQTFYSLIETIHNEVKADRPAVRFPEIDIRDLWERMFRRFHIKNADSEIVSLLFEQAVNPVEESAAAQEAIIFFNERRMIQGLSSNAQWYTISELQNCFGELISTCFSSEYFFMSWILGLSKPDTLFYSTIARTVMERGYNPDECLFIGDDPVNDVSEPGKHGFNAICCRDKIGGLKKAHDLIHEFQSLAGPSE